MDFRATLGAVLLAGILAAPNATAGDRLTGQTWTTRSEVFAKHGMAATAHPLATMTAIDVLQNGGSAVDAAIAANAVLGVVEPTGCGIGGDLFAIVWDNESKQLYGLNGSGRSPKSLTLETLKKELGNAAEIPAFGPLPVSVPGTVDGWWQLHQRFGVLPWADVLAPGIETAREGFPMTEVIGYYWERNAKALAKRGFENFKKTYMPGGESPKKGDIFKNPDLASTYEKIAKGGRDAFYDGEVAETIGAYMKRMGGYLSADDLRAHRSTWVKPVRTNYRGYDVWELPPNGQGIAALQMLNLLEPYDIAKMGWGSAEYLHTLVEAKKVAFADRAEYYADPAMADVPVASLISKAYAAKRGEKIGPRAAKSVDAGNPALGHGDTTYLTVADAKGNMVSLIQSNYRGMGSGMVPDGLGFNLQDRGQLFSLDPNHRNAYAPGKRPFHTIIPAFVSKDGKPWLSFGVMGGPVQPQMHVQIIVDLIDFGMNFQEAGDAPRLVHAGASQPTGGTMTDGGVVMVESGFPEATLKALKRKGHTVKVKKGGYGGYQAIAWDADRQVWIGASESRKDGMAAGY